MNKQLELVAKSYENDLQHTQDFKAMLDNFFEIKKIDNVAGMSQYFLQCKK